jgi:rod shape-determining protein MreC
MNTFKSRFFLVLLVIAVFFVTVSSVLSLTGNSFIVRNTVNVISFPFRYIANFIGNGAEGFVRYFKNIDKLIDENNALKEENKNLRDELADKNAAIEENDRLRDYLELYETHTSYYFKEATVIGYESSSYMSTLTLNVGSLHGISKKMPVIVTDGIVGHVSEVGLNWCRVVTLIENYSSVGAYTDRTGALGVVEGDYSLKDSGLCYFKNIKADADVKVGDKVVSSGVGSIYPEGFEIGEVVEIKSDSVSRTLVAKIKLSADLTSLTKVMVLTGIKED